MTETQAKKRKSLFELIGDVPGLVTDLVKSEIELLKAELIGKLKAIGIGAGILAGAAIVALLFVGVLLTAAILGLAEVMPGWLAALLVALVLAIVVVVLALIGRKKLMEGVPPVPEKALESVRRDLDAIKGTGKRTSGDRSGPAGAR
jgi:MFS family permease